MTDRLASATARADEAFAEARERDVPILLSVGYSSCHWCHVMAHDRVLQLAEDVVVDPNQARYAIDDER